MAIVKDSGMEALEKLKSTEPPVFLAPSSISDVARVASQYLFTKLKPYNPKSPFDELLIDGFDAEQIWQQIDMQSQPLLLSLKHEVKRFANNPQEISKLGNLVVDKDDVDEMVMDDDEERFANNPQEISKLGNLVVDKDDVDEMDMDDDEDEEEDEEEKDEENEGVEDKFFKIKELEKFLEDGEAEEYGIDHKSKKGVSKGKKEAFSDDEDDDDDDDDDEEDEEFGLFAGGDIEDSESEDSENEDSEKVERARNSDKKKKKKIRYEDFFGSGGKTKETKKKLRDLSEDQEEPSEDEEEEPERENQIQAVEKLSTHEKERLKLQSKIEQMEKASLDPKHWTMQGEVTAAKRPKNSALEVDLDFEHNVRPAPAQTLEASASLEELIKSRIIEGRFDDVERAPVLPTKTKREAREVDENKSKRGLAEVYEAEYVQKANPAFVPLTQSDELKKEASMLFKKLCLKFDALSHFHFTPKPVIEEMSIQTNVPAITMEEVAPVAVSVAAMLAPEEIFVGKGNIKDESELTQEDRKRRRAKKKRKFKAESANQPVKKVLDTTTENPKTAV